MSTPAAEVGQSKPRVPGFEGFYLNRRSRFEGLTIGDIRVADVCSLAGMTAEEIKEWSGGNVDAERGRIVFGEGDRATVIDLTAKTLTLPAWNRGVFTPQVFDAGSAIAILATRVGGDKSHHKQLTLVLPTQEVADMGEVIYTVVFEEGRSFAPTFYHEQYLDGDPINSYHNAIARANRMANRAAGRG